MDRPSMLKATLIGGAVFGFLGAVPLVGAINCACCALVIAGGMLAAFVYSNDSKKLGLAFGAADGAKVGLFTGLIYAVVNAIFQGLFTIMSRAVFGEQDWGAIIDQMEEAGAPPEALDFAEQAIEVVSGPMGPVIGFGVVLVAALVFSTIGGLIGGAVFKFEPPKQVPPAPPVPPSFTEPGDPTPGP